MSAEKHTRRQELAVLTRANHDMRSPLSVILGVFELLEDAASLTQGERRYLQLGMKAAEELLALADGLRLYSAMERDLVTLEGNAVDLQSLAREQLERALGDRRIAIETEPGDPEPPRAQADEGYLKLALAGLTRHLATNLPRSDAAAQALALSQRLHPDGMVALEVTLRSPGTTDSDAGASETAPDELGVVNGMRLIELMGGRVEIGVAPSRLEVFLPAAERKRC